MAMDGKLARGYARQSLRNFGDTYPAALAALSTDLLPYCKDLYTKGKLSRGQAKAVVSAFTRHVGSQPHFLWMERFGDASHPKLSQHFTEGLHCLRLNLARCQNGATALIAHADRMLATRHRIEFRSADLAVAITDHALVRLLERGDERIAAFSQGLMPDLLLAKVFMAQATAGSQPIVIPHQRGMFLGQCEHRPGHAQWCSMRTRTFDRTGEHDVVSAPMAARGGAGPVVILSTFVGEAEMSDGQRQLRDQLRALTKRHAGTLVDDNLAEALCRPLGEALVAGREIDLTSLRELEENLRRLTGSPLWLRTVRGPAHKSVRVSVAPLRAAGIQ